jgi:hypothetical protein
MLIVSLCAFMRGRSVLDAVSHPSTTGRGERVSRDFLMEVGQGARALWYEIDSGC